MFVEVFAACIEGVKRPTVDSGPAIYGNLVTELENGRRVARLWPYDKPPHNMGGKEWEPVATLWYPELSAVDYTSSFKISGLERVPAGRHARWVAQSWLCRPISYESLRKSLGPDPRFGEIKPTVPHPRAPELPPASS